MLGAGRAEDGSIGGIIGLFLDCLHRVVVVLLYTTTRGLDHHRFGRHCSCHNRAVVVIVAVVVGFGDTRLGKLGLCDGRNCGRIGRGDGRCGGGCRLVVTMDAHHSGTSARGLLRRHGAHDGIVARGGGSDTAAQTGRDTRGTTAAIVGEIRERRVAQITRHEEVLVGNRTGERWHGRDERRSIGRGAVGDAGNVSDLDDIRGAGANGGSDGVGGLAGLLGGSAALFLALVSTTTQTVFIALLADEEPPDEANENGDERETTNDTTSNGTSVVASTRGITAGAGAGAAGGSSNAFGGSALVARLADHGTGGPFFTGGT